MPYIQVKRGKPTMYQSGEQEFICKGLGAEFVGVSARGAYTGWKNQVALNEMPSDQVDRLKAIANAQSITSRSRFV
jgi:hypothetical protein